MARNDGVDRTTVRNVNLSETKISNTQRHNEREKDSYRNEDIVPERTAYNVHYKTPTGSYSEMFAQMEASKIISTRGLKEDADHYGELIFDVNSAYFHNHGGYEFAKKFYEDAYKAAIEIVGGEQYILSAVMHADERNRAMSEALGKDVYHYHLHVVYIPVVEKKVLWTKRCKDPALVGKVKETIMQVSSSKKWLSKPAVDEMGQPILQKNGKPVLKKSYSQLQDDFFNHMRAAGYDDVERGERGSTEEHLTVMQFKIGQEQARLEELQETKAEISSEIEHEESKLDKTKSKIQKQKLDLEHIEQIEAKPALLSSKVTVEKSDFDALKTAAQKYVMQEKKESRLQKELDKAKKMIADLTAALKALRAELAQHKSVLSKLNRIDLEQENAELKARIRWYDTIIDTKNLRELFSRYDHRRQQERQ
ncbi:MAG: plasmid recombination protein [Clostridia bacterium]|nr:plasmid recombination protein [Clostridia bacterium]